MAISLTAAEYDKVRIISLFLQRGFRTWINGPGTAKKRPAYLYKCINPGWKKTLDLDSFVFGFHNSMKKKKKKNEWHFVLQTESSGNVALAADEATRKSLIYGRWVPRPTFKKKNMICR